MLQFESPFQIVEQYSSFDIENEPLVQLQIAVAHLHPAVSPENYELYESKAMPEEFDVSMLPPRVEGVAACDSGFEEPGLRKIPGYLEQTRALRKHFSTLRAVLAADVMFDLDGIEAFVGSTCMHACMYVCTAQHVT